MRDVAYNTKEGPTVLRGLGGRERAMSEPPQDPNEFLLIAADAGRTDVIKALLEGCEEMI